MGRVTDVRFRMNSRLQRLVPRGELRRFEKSSPLTGHSRPAMGLLYLLHKRMYNGEMASVRQAAH